MRTSRSVQAQGGMSRHEQPWRGEKDEWLTPPEILRALGPFDLDPCAPVERPWPMAARHFTELDNGLLLPWDGRVWLNPPYGPETSTWLERMALHRNGVALFFARTETAWFQKLVFPVATGILFLSGRLTFYRSDGSVGEGNSGAPSALAAYSEADLAALRESGLKGTIVTGWEPSR